MCVALLGLCASAQEKGDMAVGLNLGAAPCVESGANLTNFGAGVKFQYNFSNPFRAELAVNYWFKAKEISAADAAVNAHWLFNVGEKFIIYPVVGVGMLRASVDTGSEDASEVRFMSNVGVGAEYPVTEKISVGVECKYQYVKDFARVPVNLSVTYKF